MRKFLRTIRFDQSDDHVYQRAAAAGEFAVSGSFAFVDLAPDALSGKIKQAFANGFLGATSFGWSTFSTVGEIDDSAKEEIKSRLAMHFVSQFGAPSLEAALPAAQAELAFIEDLCRDVPINTVFTVRRLFDVTGSIKEEFRTIKPPSGELMHARIWTVDDEA